LANILVNGPTYNVDDVVSEAIINLSTAAHIVGILAQNYVVSRGNVRILTDVGASTKRNPLLKVFMEPQYSSIIVIAFAAVA
jgi:hypothetical protein